MAAQQREPFDAEEAALARLYASLPGGEPPSALDARVLAQARAATTPKRRKRPWFLMPGAGAAAAAVMAAGLAWQLGWIGDGAVESVTRPAPPQATAPAAAPKAEEQKERVDIDYVRQERPRDAAAANEVSADTERARSAARPPAAPPPPPAPAPPAEARKQVQAIPEFVPEPPAPVVLDEATPAPGAIAQEAPAETAAAPASQLGAAAGRAASSDRFELGRASTLPPWPKDAQLAPADWLERVRERVRLGDRQGAEFSLRRFVQMHPTQAVPAELQRLLVE